MFILNYNIENNLKVIILPNLNRVIFFPYVAKIWFDLQNRK